MSKEQNVVEFYVICNRLKNLIRTGWNEWQVSAERVESVAEHVYGVQMLAIAMWSEYNYSIDLKTVLFMLAVHELEETVIGDLTLFDMSASSKKELGHNAVCKILSNLANSQVIQDIIFEFDDEVWESSYTSCGTEYNSWNIKNYGVVGYCDESARYDFTKYKYNENSVEANLHENNALDFAEFVSELGVIGNIFDNPELLKEETLE